MNMMSVSELIEKVFEICKANGVKRLDLFGSFATGTAMPTNLLIDIIHFAKEKYERAICGKGNFCALSFSFLEIKTGVNFV